MAERILALLNDPEAARTRGHKLRARVIEHYTWAQAGERITSVYQEVCPHPKGVI